jgi:hypothetical protein
MPGLLTHGWQVQPGCNIEVCGIALFRNVLDMSGLDQ